MKQLFFPHPSILFDLVPPPLPHLHLHHYFPPVFTIFSLGLRTSTPWKAPLSLYMVKGVTGSLLPIFQMLYLGLPYDPEKKLNLNLVNFCFLCFLNFPFVLRLFWLMDSSYDRYTKLTPPPSEGGTAVSTCVSSSNPESYDVIYDAEVTVPTPMHSDVTFFTPITSQTYAVYSGWRACGLAVGLHFGSKKTGKISIVFEDLLEIQSFIEPKWSPS